MKVYVVLYHYYDNVEVHGVFSTREKAVEHLNGHHYYTVKELELDEGE